MRDWKLESLANGKEIPPFRSERKKRSTSEGTPQFPNGISGKLPYHLTSNRIFRIFSPNGKHPLSPLPSGLDSEYEQIGGQIIRMRYQMSVIYR